MGKIYEMKGYTVIDEVKKPEGLYQLWESNRFGDEVAAPVTLNGERIGETYDRLEEWIDENI